LQHLVNQTSISKTRFYPQWRFCLLRLFKLDVKSDKSHNKLTSLERKLTYSICNNLKTYPKLELY